MVDRDLSFERLIDPVTRQEFLGEYWEKKPLILHRHSPFFYDSVLSFAEIDHLLHVARESLTGTLRVVPPPGSDSDRRGKFQGKEISHGAAYKAFASGDTLQLSSVDLLWPPIAALRAALREALDTDANINVYATPANSQGFALHYDTHDTLILQVDGSKIWYIYDRYVDSPVEQLSYKELAPYEQLAGREGEVNLLQEVRLEKGDMLYLPRGFPHKAVATENASLHLTIGIHPMYWVDLLKAAMETICLEHVELRRALPPGFMSDPEVRSTMAVRFREILDLAASQVHFEKTLDELTSLRIRNQMYPPDGHFSQLLQVSALIPDSVVRRRRGLDCRLVEQNGTRGLTFARNEVRGPAQIGPALEYIRDHRQFRVGDLPGLADDQSRIVLVRRFIREGLLRVVAAAPPG